MSARDKPDAKPNPFQLIAQKAIADLTPEQGADAAMRDARRAAQEHQERQSAWLDAALATARLRGVRFIMENPDADSVALRYIRGWFTAPKGPHILLRGPTGTGKTVAAAWLVRHCTEPNEARGSVAWLYPDDVCSAVLHERWDEKAPKLARYVVVDEVGTETRPEFTKALARLLDRDSCSVVMTSNLSKQAFEERYGSDDRLTNRSGASVEVYDIPGKSKRKPLEYG